MYSHKVFLLLICLQAGALAAQDNGSLRDSFALPSRQQFIEDLHRRSFSYFLKLTDKSSGLVPEKHPGCDYGDVSASGFGLTAWIIGAGHGYINRKEAADRVLKTLRFLLKIPKGANPSGYGCHHGFFYQHLDLKKGRRYADAMITTLSNAILMEGIICCQTYFDSDRPVERKIRSMADLLYRRVDWNWALNKRETPCTGWAPEIGFNEEHWYGYNESMLIMILALGSPTHPIPPECWNAWSRTFDWGTFEGYELLNCGPMAGHQTAQAFIDFRGIKDAFMLAKGSDYFENSRKAALSQRNYAIRNPMKFRDYSDSLWGLTTSDGPRKERPAWSRGDDIFKAYSARGAANHYLNDDGTIAPSAAGGSVPFAPGECLSALEKMVRNYGNELYGEFGFKNAFNPTFRSGSYKNGWFSEQNHGVDEGLILLMLENYQSGLIWNLMKKTPTIIRGLKKAGFRGGWLDEPPAGPPK